MDTSYQGDVVDEARLDAVGSLSKRLIEFRRWLSTEAQATIHPSLCIVNGEATDGTRNAPVLVLDSLVKSKEKGKGERIGNFDGDKYERLYECTMGCQVRATRDINVDETIMSIPRTAMVTPDVVAASDAGRVVLGCCEIRGDTFWETFDNTVECEQRAETKLAQSGGPQVLLKILQERKRAEEAYKLHMSEGSSNITLAKPGTVSTRAPLLAFLIQQRFSDHPSPLVSSSAGVDVSPSIGKQNGYSKVKGQVICPGTPASFASYARTLPSRVSVPLCWTRNELSMLTMCPVGVDVLKDVAKTTIHLVDEFTSLLRAGILSRFESVFPSGLLTWDRWVWASVIFASRSLPASCYADEGVSLESLAEENSLQFQSPAHIWRELGVLIPFLDMLNHELDTNNVTWRPPSDGSHPSAFLHKRMRKGAEVYTSYGTIANKELVSQYGFALVSNPDDEALIGIGLVDADCCISQEASISRAGQVLDEDSSDSRIDQWWSKDRMELLQSCLQKIQDDRHMQGAPTEYGEECVKALRSGQKLVFTVYCDGSYDPMLLAFAVVATAPPGTTSTWNRTIVKRRHMQSVLIFLERVLETKVEALLRSLHPGIKEEFQKSLWAKTTNGGINYTAGTDKFESDADIGWNHFYDTEASTVEVNGKCYAMGVTDCVLTLYDCQFKALQGSVNDLREKGVISPDLLQQLCTAGFKIDNVQSVKERQSVSSESCKEKVRKSKKTTSPAVKLHVGNLSSDMTTSDLHDFFVDLCGESEVFECHMPKARGRNKSRGYGFVCLAVEAAERVLDSNEIFKLKGIEIRIARSSSVGASEPSAKVNVAGLNRCGRCGYRPKYCMCTSSRQLNKMQGTGGRHAWRDYRDERYDYYPSPRRMDDMRSMDVDLRRRDHRDWSGDDRYRERYCIRNKCRESAEYSDKSYNYRDRDFVGESDIDNGRYLEDYRRRRGFNERRRNRSPSSESSYEGSRESYYRHRRCCREERTRSRQSKQKRKRVRVDECHSPESHESGAVR